MSREIRNCPKCGLSELSPVHIVDCGEPIPDQRKVTVREEWMVTGEPGELFPSYRFVFGSPIRLASGKDADPEAAAREFVDGIENATAGPWREGPHLHKRTVTETPWEEVAR